MSVKQFVARFSTLLVGCALLPAASFAQLSFQPSQPVANGFTVVAQGDFNNDGREDLEAFDETSDSGPAYLYLSNGDGTYRAPIMLPNSIRRSGVQTIGDFNRDGKLDFATVVFGSTDLTVYLGNGDGTFQAPRNTTGTVYVPQSLLAVDLNHDGKTDLVEFILSYSNGTIIPVRLQLLISNGDGTFSKGQNIVAATGSLTNQVAQYALTGDFDGDSKPDIALLYGYIQPSNTQPTTVQVFYGDGAGRLGSPSLTTDPNKYSDSRALVADVNNDGRSDIVAVPGEINNVNGPDLPLLTVFTGNANRTLDYSTIATNQCVGLFGGTVAVADFNGDGLNDIAYQESACNTFDPVSSVTDIAIKLGTGASKFGAEQVVYQNLDTTESPFAIKSTLGSKPDIVFSEAENNGSTSAIELLTNTSDGAFPGCGPSGFAEGVKVCAPGTTAASPVKFSVGAAGPTPMRTAQVWADGKKATEQLTHAFSNYSFLDASVPLAAGSHRISVLGTGWDGSVETRTFTLTVTGSSSCSAPTSPGVHLCAPASGSTVSSPVTIQATAAITGKLGSMQVWIDGVKKFSESTSTSLNTSLSVAAGTHRFAVLAINTTGQKWESAVNATVK